MLTKNIIKAICEKVFIDFHQTIKSETAEQIADEILSYINLEKTKAQLTAERNLLCKEHQQKLKELDHKVDALRHSCYHYSEHYEADPAGGSGDIVCDLCGRER